MTKADTMTNEELITTINKLYSKHYYPPTISSATLGAKIRELFDSQDTSNEITQLHKQVKALQDLKTNEFNELCAWRNWAINITEDKRATNQRLRATILNMFDDIYLKLDLKTKECKHLQNLVDGYRKEQDRLNVGTTKIQGATEFYKNSHESGFDTAIRLLNSLAEQVATKTEECERLQAAYQDRQRKLSAWRQWAEKMPLFKKE